MEIFRKSIERATSAELDILDLTDEVVSAVAESGIVEGSVLVFTPGSTAGITTIEFETGAVNDLRRAVERLVPRDQEYEHDRRWGDGNGYSHVRAALLGPSLTLPVSGARPLTGTWQQVVLCDFDNKPRNRQIVLQVSGRRDGKRRDA